MLSTRTVLLTCTSFVSTTMLLTVVLLVNDDDLDQVVDMVDRVEHEANQPDLTARTKAAGARLFHRYPYKPLERKPQGHDEGPEVEYIDGGKSNSVSKSVELEEVSDVTGMELEKQKQNLAELSVVEGKIYWSRQVEQFVHVGVTDAAVNEFKLKTSTKLIKSIQAAKWNMCGRPKNQFITLEDGTNVCARYRHPQDTLVHGELLSFYLSRLLGLDSVPAVTLSLLDSHQVPWCRQNLTVTGWREGQLVALIDWINDLSDSRSRVFLPSILLSCYEFHRSLTGSILQQSVHTLQQLTTLVQWTDLIVFDYITGHYDRVASMQDGAEQELNPDIMRESIRNVRCSWPTGKLWLLDNESGLLDAYTLMYGHNAGSTGLRFLQYHQNMLHSTCLFHKDTISKVHWLSEMSNPDEFLQTIVQKSEPLYSPIKQTEDYQLFKKYFRIRLKEVVSWVEHCKTL